MSKTLVSSAYDLDLLLHSELGKELESESFATLFGGVDGSYKGKPFYISFKKNEYLLLSYENDGKEVLKEMYPILSCAMGEPPICSYDLQSENEDEKEAQANIEWDIKDPEKRISDIVNGRVLSEGNKVHNLILFGERRIEDYIEDEKAKAERLANARIYGINPGNLPYPEKVVAASEAELFLTINTYRTTMSMMNHATKRDEEPVDLTEYDYALDFCVYQTRKFGVELPDAEIDKRVTRTSSFVSWAIFWDNHFSNNLNEKEKAAYSQARKKGEDVSAFMPKVSWKDTLKEPEKQTTTEPREEQGVRKVKTPESSLATARKIANENKSE